MGVGETEQNEKSMDKGAVMKMKGEFGKVFNYHTEYKDRKMVLIARLKPKYERLFKLSRRTRSYRKRKKLLLRIAKDMGYRLVRKEVTTVEEQRDE